MIGIGKVESETALLSDVVDVFMELSDLYQIQNLKKLVEDEADYNYLIAIFEKRIEDNFINKYHHLAYFLDHRYRGGKLATDETYIVTVLKTLEEYGTLLEIIKDDEDKKIIGTQLTNFRLQVPGSLFSLPLLTANEPKLYWKNFMSYESSKKLAIIAHRLFTIPASSATVERGFSMYARIHSKARSRLSRSSVDKLMRVQWALRKMNYTEDLKNDDDFDFIDLCESGSD